MLLGSYNTQILSALDTEIRSGRAALLHALLADYHPVALYGSGELSIRAPAKLGFDDPVRYQHLPRRDGNPMTQISFI